ncbi:MAG: hypothetical protein AAF297_12685, partial [Planctomycetota bacterium]
GYDPQRFPSPTSPPPDMAGAAMEHFLRFGEYRELTDEELRDAVKIDPSQIAGLGPSLDALIAMLEERRRKILETYETDAAQRAAEGAFGEAARDVVEGPTDLSQRGGGKGRKGKRGGSGRSDVPPSKIREVREAVREAAKAEQIRDLERVWYAAERVDSGLAGEVMGVIDRLGDRYEVDELAARWDFVGRTEMSVPEALAVKEELETIEKLLEQLREAQKDAKIGVVDLDELSRFVDEAGVDELRGLQEQVENYMREQAERQGLEQDGDGNWRASPATYKIFQASLLDEIFSDLDPARTGNHRGPVVGEGVVEIAKTRGYEFGDSPAEIDVPQTVVNAAVRGESAGGRPRIGAEDIEVHLTRNTPKCATALIVDMSGSMSYGGQYVACKRMAIALDGLIRSEYPGDFLSVYEMASFAKMVPPGELAKVMPKPVTTRDPVVRLRVDMSDPEISESMVHPHFTNIQHGLELARRQLSGQDTPNKQVFVITDGLPTAHFENGPETGVKKKAGDGRHLYLLYPPDPLTERATMREAAACAREGITINVFLIPSWSQDEDDIAFAHRMAETTKGRVIFTAGKDLDRFVLWDYVSHRRRVIG